MNLKTATLQSMSSFSNDEKLSQCFISVEDAIASAEEMESKNQQMPADKNTIQFYNNKEIIDSTGVGKDFDGEDFRVELKTTGELPFISARPDILSPHADTLDIGDLDDIDSVKSEQSD